jgi:hypothetical protein
VGNRKPVAVLALRAQCRAHPNGLLVKEARRGNSNFLRTLARGLALGLVLQDGDKLFPGPANWPPVPGVAALDAPVKKPRVKKNLLAVVKLPEFKTLCAGLDLTLEQGLALGYRLILRSLTENVKP